MSRLNLLIISIMSLLILFGCSKKEDEQKTNQTKIDLLSDEWPGWAIAYSGYRDGQDPTKRIYPTKDQILEDLKILERNWKIIRTYGADQHLIDVLEVIDAEKIDLKVMIGIWLDGAEKYADDNKTQIKLGIELTNRFKDIVIAVNVANESQVFWSPHKLPQEKLISFIREVKSKVDVPVTTADTWDYWTNLEESQKVIDEVDFIAAHTYPIWGGIDIDNAMEVTKNTYDSLVAAIPNKKILITEAGWATYTVGDSHAPKAGDEVKQKKYFEELMQWSKEQNIIVFTFEAFDEPWKGTGTEGYWGLFNVDRKAKLVMHKLYPELVTDKPTSPSYE